MRNKVGWEWNRFRDELGRDNGLNDQIANTLKALHPCPIHPHRLELSKSTDDSTYRKSSRKRKRISCLPEVKLMDVGVYKMLTTRHDSTGSSRLVPTRVDSTRWKSIRSNSTQVAKEITPNASKHVDNPQAQSSKIPLRMMPLSFMGTLRGRDWGEGGSFATPLPPSL